jgi:2-methylcitrate dehydratase PrpD
MMNSQNKGTSKDGELVTKALARFVSETGGAAISPELSTKAKCLLLDYLGVSSSAAFSAESSPSFLAAIKSFAGSAQGQNTVLVKGSSFLPQYAALLNGAWCHTYDFDDTHLDAVLHPGSSLISAALAEAETQNAPGTKLLTALLVGYEVACRLGIALNFGAYDRGFHNTGTVGLYGSIAAVCKLRNCPQQVVEDAFGLAVSKAAGSMQFLDNGAWNKRLHPGFAAHDALLCVTLAEAGVLGASRAVEGKYGLLHNYSSSGDPSQITKGLGNVWRFIETACKPFPACRMTHGQLEMVGRLRKEHESRGIPDKVTVTLHPDCYPIVGVPNPNKVNPKVIVDAQFSSYYQVAASWYYGNGLGWSIYDKLHDEKVQQFCSRVTCEVNDSFTPLQSRLKVVFKDGTTIEEEVLFPLGEPQRPFEWNSGVHGKFMGLAEPVYGKARCDKICDAVNGLENINGQDLMKLLATP